ncbi:MAG: sugar phosphate nucleotidyltransferase [Candidatus Omnitrophota bacterium]
MNYAIILAGGTGTRFWPLSRQMEPKQFLNVFSSKSMMEETIGRIVPLIKKKNIHIASGRAYGRKVIKLTKDLRVPARNILLEPRAKNTFAPIAVLSRLIDLLDPEAVVIVLPSDHFVKDGRGFRRLLNEGIKIARKGYIVSLGVPPLRPETGYGYIKRGSRSGNFYRIEEFIEKPDLKRAKRFSRDKKYYWNSGVFIFRPQALLEEIKRLLPGVYKDLLEIKNNRDSARLWQRLPSISIDYAIMEKSARMALLPADCGWTDLGSWEALGEIAKKDKNGNVFRGKVIDIGSRSTMALSDKRLIATVGLNDIIIVDTHDALLVCRKDMSQDIRKIVGILKGKNSKGLI